MRTCDSSVSNRTQAVGESVGTDVADTSIVPFVGSAGSHTSVVELKHEAAGAMLQTKVTPHDNCAKLTTQVDASEQASQCVPSVSEQTETNVKTKQGNATMAHVCRR